MTLTLHHSLPLDHVRFGVISPDPRGADPDFATAYAWLAERTGFWPAFLAVGDDERALRMTGYQDQWRRVLARGPTGSERRPAGVFPSLVLFSFSAPPPGAVFCDFDNWHFVLNGASPSRRQQASIFRPSWSHADWLRAARRGSASVQAVVPVLDLALADRIWCRNAAAHADLIKRGFEPDRVGVRRIRVGEAAF